MPPRSVKQASAPRTYQVADAKLQEYKLSLARLPLSSLEILLDSPELAVEELLELLFFLFSNLFIFHAARCMGSTFSQRVLRNTFARQTFLLQPHGESFNYVRVYTQRRSLH